MTELNFTTLLGRELTVVNKTDDSIDFVCADGATFTLYHEPDCCESVRVEDVNGDLDDLIGSPIVLAEKSTSSENPEGITKDYQDDSFTWTFYRIGTVKGTVVIRWYGESNGYYSESVTFAQTKGGSK